MLTKPAQFSFLQIKNLGIFFYQVLGLLSLLQSITQPKDITGIIQVIPKLTIPLLLSPKGVFLKGWQTTSEASLSFVLYSYFILKTIPTSLFSRQTLVLLLLSSYQKWKEKIKKYVFYLF